MKKPLAISLIVLAFCLACGAETVGTMKPLATQTPTVTKKALATDKPLATPTSTPTPEKVFIHGSYNLRAKPKGGGHAYGHVSNELVTLIRTHTNGWLKIQVGDKTGWVSPLAAEEK